MERPADHEPGLLTSHRGWVRCIVLCKLFPQGQYDTAERYFDEGEQYPGEIEHFAMQEQYTQEEYYPEYFPQEEYYPDESYFPSMQSSHFQPEFYSYPREFDQGSKKGLKGEGSSTLHSSKIQLHRDVNSKVISFIKLVITSSFC